MKLFDIQRNYNFVCCLFDKSVVEMKTTRKFHNVVVVDAIIVVVVVIVFRAMFLWSWKQQKNQQEEKAHKIRFEKN